MLRVDTVGYIEMRNPRLGAESLGRLGLGLWNQVPQPLCLQELAASPDQYTERLS